LLTFDPGFIQAFNLVSTLTVADNIRLVLFVSDSSQLLKLG
jgi:ABC-type lipoprotein export system ATPase subunit